MEALSYPSVCPLLLLVQSIHAYTFHSLCTNRTNKQNQNLFCRRGNSRKNALLLHVVELPPTGLQVPREVASAVAEEQLRFQVRPVPLFNNYFAQTAGVTIIRVNAGRRRSKQRSFAKRHNLWPHEYFSQSRLPPDLGAGVRCMRLRSCGLPQIVDQTRGKFETT